MLVLAPFLSRRYAGAAHATISIVNALQHDGHDVHVVAFEVEDGILAKGVHVQLVPAPRSRRFVWRIGRGFAVRDYRHALKQASLPVADIMYTQSMEFGLAFRSLDVRTPIVSHFGHVLARREAEEESPLAEPWRTVDVYLAARVESKCYRQRHWTHVVSTRLVAEARCSEFNLPPAFFTVQPLGVLPDRFQPAGDRRAVRRRLGLQDSDVAIACVARLVTWKNHRWIINAMRRLPSHCVALMVGEGPQHDALVAELPPDLRGRVRFTGHQDPIPYLQAADVFALPSTIESFGVAYVEAMFMGLPCVGLAYDPPAVLSSAAEVIEDGVTGFVVGSEEEFGEKLRLLCSDAHLRERLGSAGRERAYERFDVRRYAGFLEAHMTGVREDPAGDEYPALPEVVQRRETAAR